MMNRWCIVLLQCLIAYLLIQWYRLSNQASFSSQTKLMKIYLHIFLLDKEFVSVQVQLLSTATFLHEEFNRWFKDFRKVENEIQLLTCPFYFNVEKAPANLQLKLIAFWSTNGMKQKFNYVKCANFNFKDLGKKIIPIFVSTCNVNRYFL